MRDDLRKRFSSMSELRWQMLYSASLSIITVRSVCSSDKYTPKTVLYGSTTAVAKYAPEAHTRDQKPTPPPYTVYTVRASESAHQFPCEVQDEIIHRVADGLKSECGIVRGILFSRDQLLTKRDQRHAPSLSAR